jgi:hypothetical protein
MDGNIVGVSTNDGNIILVDTFGTIENAPMKILA